LDHKGHEGHEGHEGHKGLPVELEGFARTIVDSGLKVHRALGPGLLESAYEHCLAHELSQRGVALRRQVPLPIVYEGTKLDAGYRLDIVVEGSIVIEIKAVEALSRLHEAQVLTYLKLSGKRLGFLMNFNVELFKNGVRRLAL
jgi:GxxExxY protein